MTHPSGHDVYAAPYRTRVTRLGSTELIASRTTSAQLGRNAIVSAQRSDMFGFAFQVAPLNGDEFWNDDGHMRLPFVAEGSIHIADMRAGGTVRFVDTAFDSLNLAIPSAALRELAERNDTAAASELRVPEAWTTRDPFVISLAPALRHALFDAGGMESLASDHLILSLLSHLAIRYGGMTAAAGALTGALSPRKLQLAQSIMMDRAGQHLSLADLARTCDLSPSHFSRAFKQATGKPPSRWLSEHRVARAKDLLRRNELTLAEIAYSCGFADQSHFTRTFTRHTGRPPGLWRRDRA